MNHKTKRHTRIDSLHKAAKTKKFTWQDLRVMARNFGISEPTVKSYLDEVYSMLKKENLIK